jgi:phospholipase/carboxylesterase
MNTTANAIPDAPGTCPQDESSVPGMGLSLVALHGLAGSREEVDRMATEVKSRMALPNVRWLFPKARRRRVSLLGGAQILAWYDVFACDRSRMDEDGIEAATEAVCRMVRAERRRGGGALVLMGFSQGGFLALHAGLRLQEELQGIVALACGLPFLERVPEAGPRTPPIFLGHGLFDCRVTHALGRESCRLLRSRGYDVSWRTYLCGHTIVPRELRDVTRWLDRRVLHPRRAATALGPRAVAHGSRALLG